MDKPAAPGPVAQAPRFGFMWQVMRSIGDMSLPTFFSSVAVEGTDNLPPSDHPVIVCSTHHSTILDVAILASHMPDSRPLHFWAKSGLFHNPISNFILASSGNIKVDRCHKNNHALFQGTFQALNNRAAVALFPEGGSYSNPAITNLKPGAAWAALEYIQHLRLQAHHADNDQARASINNPLRIIPTAIVYSDKSRFRSRAILRFGKPIALERYLDEFLSPNPAASSSSPDPSSVATIAVSPEPSPAHRAVARLTADIQAAIAQITFNAPDWQSFQAVRAARQLIWDIDSHRGRGEKELDMRHFVDASNALLALLSRDGEATRGSASELASASRDARHALFTYSALLELCETDSRILSHVIRRHGRIASASSASGQAPSSPSLSPLPTRRAAFGGLCSAAKSLAVRLPYLLPTFIPTLLPTYLLPSSIAHHFAKKEEESLASVKTLVGFGFSLLLYLYGLFAMTRWTRWNPSGFFLGAVGIWWMVELNRSCVDTAYSLLRQCRLSWAVWKAAGRRHQQPPSAVKPHSVPSAKTRTNNQIDAALLSISDDPTTFNIFFYGTLVHPRILSRVIGKNGSHLMIQNGVLPSHALCHIRGQEYPALISQANLSSMFSADEASQLIQSGRAAVKGTLVCGLTAHDVRCLDTFEDDEYSRRTVSITLDASSPACSNVARLERGDDQMNLETILAPLTPDRIAHLLKTTQRGEAVQVEAQVYKWTAPLDRLEAKVWEFDEFARTKAKRWVSERWEETVEMEFEYEIVDAIRQEGTQPPSPVASAETSASVEEAKETVLEQDVTDWYDAYAAKLTSHAATRDAIVRTLSSLSQHPSIQYYVDLAFRPEPTSPSSGRTKTKRPGKNDFNLIAALYASRYAAEETLKRLIDLSSREEEGESVRFLWEKARERGRGKAGWPFAVLDADVEDKEVETKKDR